MELRGILIDTIDNYAIGKSIDEKQIKNFLNFVYCKKPELKTLIVDMAITKKTSIQIAILYNNNALENMEAPISSYGNKGALTYGTIFIVGYANNKLTSLSLNLIHQILDKKVVNKFGRVVLQL